MINVLLMILYTAAAGGAAWSIVRLLFGERPAWWRLAVALPLVPVLIAVELTLLGVIGWLAPHVAGPVMVVLALVLWIAGRGKAGVAPGEGLFTSPLSRESAVALAALVGALLPPVARALLTGPQFGYDDYSYHAPYVAQWMLDGRISILSFNYHVYFPFNAELFSLWFMLPVGTDTYVGIGGAYWSIAVAVAVTALALSVGRRVEAALLAAGLVVISTLVAITALRFSANDLAPTVMITSALVVLSGSWEVRKRRAAGVIIAGLFIGFGLGAKLTVLPAVAVLLAWIAFEARGGRSASLRFGHIWLFVLGILISTGYWYGRNWVLTGNPFFPGAIAFFRGPLDAEVQDQTTLIAFLLTDPIGTLRIALPELTDWPLVLWLVATAGYVRGVIMLIRRSPAEVSSMRALEAVLLLVGVALLLAYPFQPFSGTKNLPGAPVTAEPRFLIMTFVAGIVLASRWIAGTRGVIVAASVVVIAGLAGNQAAGLATAVLAIGAWFGVQRLEGAFQFVRSHRIHAFGLLAVVCVAGAVLWKGNLERAIEQRIFSYWSAGQMLGTLWKEVDTLPAGSRVVAFGLAGNFSYPLFGRTLDLKPVMLDRAGGTLRPVHELWLAAPDRFEWWAAPPDSAQLAGLREGLLAGDVTHVAVSRTSTGLWPVQAGLLVPPRFTVIHSDPGSALYRVNR